MGWFEIEHAKRAKSVGVWADMKTLNEFDRLVVIYTLIRINRTHRSHVMFHPTGIYVYFFLDPTFAFAPVAYVLLLAVARPQKA